MNTWKSFAANEVTHSMAHYLTTIHGLHTQQGYARVSDVARELDVRKGTVSVQMRQLKEKGFVTQDENRFLHLTETGETVARQVIYNRTTIVQFLDKVLGIDRQAAEIDACKIEHLLSPETGHQILALVQCLLSDDTAAKGLLKKLKQIKGTDTIPDEVPELARSAAGAAASAAKDLEKTRSGDRR